MAGWSKEIRRRGGSDSHVVVTVSPPYLKGEKGGKERRIFRLGASFLPKNGLEWGWRAVDRVRKRIEFLWRGDYPSFPSYCTFFCLVGIEGSS